MPDPSIRPRLWYLRHRGTALVAMLALATLAYLGVILSFDLIEAHRERLFGETDANPNRLQLYLDPVSVDTPDDSLTLRVYVTPGPGLRGRAGNTLNRDVTVNLINNSSLEQRVFRANEPIVPVTIQVDLTDGDIASYPLDRYRIDLRFQANEGVPDAPGAAVPQEITVWEQLLGFKVHTVMSPGDSAGDIRLRVDVRRTDAQIFFALAAYGSMALVACNSLVISGMVFLGRRKVEATLTSALGALVFALPAMRNALPGAPPLRCRGGSRGVPVGRGGLGFLAGAVRLLLGAAAITLSRPRNAATSQAHTARSIGAP